MRSIHAAALAFLVLASGALAPPVRAAEPAPTVASVTPSKGAADGGYTVTIAGTGFAPPVSVSFGGVLSTSVVIVSPTEITAEVPPHAPGPVSVVVFQDTPPPTASNPSGTFTYEAYPCRSWIPRAPGSATGGNPGGLDVTVVDVANRRVEASLDLNPADALLQNDDAWRVTQVLFSADGAWAFLATAGVPGTSDSRRVFVVKTARLLGSEEGAPVVAALDTGGNPYQLALSADGKTLYAADGGSWKGSATAFPNGSFLAWNVTDPAAPAALGSPTTLGILPVLAYDTTAHRMWGTNSSFTGLVQSKNGRTAITNVGSHTVSTVDLGTRAVTATATAAVEGGGPVQFSVSLPSPWSDEFVLVETSDFVTQSTSYFILRTAFGDLVEKGPVSQAVAFFPVTPVPDLQNRTAWPHPDGSSLVVLPATGAKVLSWNPATGSASGSVAVPGDASPTCLAMNDVSDLFYARRSTGGWSVLSVAAARGSPPVVAAEVADATGVDSLRVVGDGTLMAGTADSSLALIDAVAASPTAHQVVAVIPLPLDPDGGPLFPQPGSLCPPARTFVVVAPPGEGPRVLLPLPGTLFCPGDAPPEFEATGGTTGAGLPLELELGSEPDFLDVPGTVRLRIPVDADSATAVPAARAWRRLLAAAAGAYTNPFWARVNAVLPSGTRIYGTTVALGVCAPEEPVRLSPLSPVEADPDAPPELAFAPAGPGRYRIELRGPLGAPLGRVRVAVDPDAEEVSVTPSGAAWRRAVRKAARRDAESITWTVLFRDLLGRDIESVDE